MSSRITAYSQHQFSAGLCHMQSCLGGLLAPWCESADIFLEDSETHTAMQLGSNRCFPVDLAAS